MRTFLRFIIFQLIFLQFLDGYLTYLGVSSLGIDMEGNLLLKSLMESIGVVPALLIFKGIAIFFCLFVAVSSFLDQIHDDRHVLFTALLAFVHLLYMVAITGWLVILIPLQRIM